MANPQLEDGHTRIANEILEAFCQIFPSGSSARVLLAIIRRTYGWNKKEDQISISQIETMTSLSRRAVIYALQNLEVQRFITVQRQRGRGNVNQVNTVSLQKNYELWVVQRKSPQYEKQLQKQRGKYQAWVVQRKEGSARNGKKVVQRIEKGSANSLHPQKTIQKTIQKTLYEILKDTKGFPSYSKENIGKLEDVMRDYPGLNYLLEFKKYKEYWNTRQLKRPWLALRNWLDRAKEGKVGTVRNPRDLPKQYTPSPDYDDL